MTTSDEKQKALLLIAQMMETGKVNTDDALRAAYDAGVRSCGDKLSHRYAMFQRSAASIREAQSTGLRTRKITKQVTDNTTKGNPMRKYFTLVCYDIHLARWYPDFGDYEKDVVVQELQDRADSSDGPLKKHMRVITTGSRQAEIDRAVEQMNDVTTLRKETT